MGTMQRKRLRGCAAAAGMLAAGILASTAASAADDGESTTLTIRASRPTEKVVGYDRTTPVRQYELSYQVSYSDLNLTTSSGADTLRSRVRQAADSLCRDIDKLYPLVDKDSNCSRQAQESAKPQIDRVIAMAQARSGAAR